MEKIKLSVMKKVKWILYFDDKRKTFYRVGGGKVEVLINDEWKKSAYTPNDIKNFELINLGEF